MESARGYIIDLPASLDAWGAANFDEVFKKELLNHDIRGLLLQQFMSLGSYACDDDMKVILLSSTKGVRTLRVKAGIFFTSIIAGCNCADDPSPVDKLNEYCELQFDIDRKTGRARVGQLS
jgi:hypothetical protein